MQFKLTSDYRMQHSGSPPTSFEVLSQVHMGVKPRAVECKIGHRVRFPAAVDAAARVGAPESAPNWRVSIGFQLQTEGPGGCKPCASKGVQAAASRDTNQSAGTMTFLRCIPLSIFLLPALVSGLAQQTYNKPVPAAKPPAATPIARPAASTPIVHPVAVSANYIIGADDSLQITVFQEPNLSETLPVRPDGKITLPLVGDITAAGISPMQLAADITARLKQFVTDPVVDVAVLAVNSKRVFLIGEIMHVGPIAITPGMTVLQAIATAGGLTPYANKKHIYILRGEPGKQQNIPFDYTRALKKGDMQGITLVPGDTIVVP